MEDFCTSFPPVVAPGCWVLVLGSMPGVQSLRATQYYAHPRNAFWPILYALWGEDAPAARYEDRLSFATAHRIAIWDVAQSCQRKGSSDAAIRDVIPNDFAGLLGAYPSLHTLCFNGRQAQAMFGNLALPLAEGTRQILLPSTSPAYATLSFREKLAAWQPLRDAAEQEIHSP